MALKDSFYLKTTRRKKDPASIILNAIKPYSLFPLDFPMDYSQRPFHPQTPLWNLEQQLSKGLPRSSQIPDLKKASYFRNFVVRCFICKTTPQIWTNRPRLHEYQEDIKAFRNIALSHPPYLAPAAVSLSAKYQYLHLIDNEYLYWPVTRSGWPEIPEDAFDQQDDLISLSEHILSNIPQDKGGRRKNSRAFWLTRETMRLWGTAGLQSTNHMTDFLKHIEHVFVLVGIKKKVTQSFAREVNAILAGTFQPTRYWECPREIGRIRYRGPKLFDFLRMKIAGIGYAATMSYRQIAIKFIHEFLFDIKSLRK